MPSRWPMPSEKAPTRLPATLVSPASSMTSSTRRRGMPCVCASAIRWLNAVRPGWTDLASSSEPISCSGAACRA